MMNLSRIISVLLLGAGLVVFSPQKSTALIVEEEPHLTKASTDFPVVKSVGLSPSMHVPWSKPVSVIDPFEGNFLGVFDRHYMGGYLYRQGSKQVISLWTRSSIRVLVTVNSGFAGSFYNAGFYYPRPDYLKFVNTKKVVKILVKVKEQVFPLEGSNNMFVVSDELATALKNAPENNLDMRLVLEGGETVDSKIGKGTVKAWRTIY